MEVPPAAPEPSPRLASADCAVYERRMIRPNTRRPPAAGGAEAPWSTPTVLAVLAIVALLARIRTFGNPIIFSDEELYLYVAGRMWHGALPYVDMWDRKPVGLFLLYMPAAALPPMASVYAYQAMALAFVVGTAFLMVAAARRVGWGRGALVAAVLYVLWLNLADGQGGQSPVLYDLPMMGAVLLVLHADGPNRRVRSVMAMALVGVAIQIKYSVVFEGVWFGLWLMWSEFRATRSIARTIGFASVLAAVTLLPTAAATAWFVADGHGQDFMFANFRSVLMRHPDPAAMQIDNAETAVELLGPLVALTVVGIGAVRGNPRQRTERLFLYGWLAVALAGFVAFGGWYNHYTLPVMLPGALGTAAVFGYRRSGRWLAIPAMILASIAGQIVLSSELRHRGTPAQFAAMVRFIGSGPGTIYTDMLHPAFHTFTGRHPLTRWMFPSHLQIAREAGAIGVDQATELDRVFAQRPEFVTIEGPFTGADPARRDQVLRLVARGGYEAPVRFPLGYVWVDIYRRADLGRTERH